MNLTEITFEEGRPVDGYGPGFFRIAGQVLQGSITVLPNGCAGWGGFDDIATIVEAGDQIDVLFVGTGADIANIPADFRAKLEDAGMGVEIMNSPSACRTYNILLSEGRRVGLALIPV